MKKYNRLIALSVIAWLVLAIGTGWSARHVTMQKNSEYKVEINRLYNSLSGEMNPDKLDLRSYKYVKSVVCISVSELEQTEKTEEFYKTDNELELEIKPLYQDEKLVGFVRFDYVMSGIETDSILIIVEIAMVLLEMFVLIVLFYLKYKLIKPFEQMQKIPEQLAKGHFKGIVKEEKSKYLGQFLWGIGQLKDKLDVTRKRTLELEKEKKTLLVSLSHDIKTPLNNIRLYAKALEENLYSNEEDKHHAAVQIGKKTAEIEKYVEEIMKHSREEILDIQVKKSEFYLKELMDKVLDDYAEKCEIRMVDLEVATYKNRLLKGDLDRSAEVFENIFENAFKYGDGRKIQIDFWEEEECQLIRIYNTGEPVSENDYNHIFESFFRAANSEGKPGSGLGLYICREIMRKMGGSIYAERKQDGMSFVLVFE